MPEDTLGMEEVMAAVRAAASGSVAGQYKLRVLERGEEYYGAYGIPRRQWRNLATMAGVSGAPIEDPGAQDRVVAFTLSRFRNETGNWTRAVAGWFGGAQSMVELHRRGVEKSDDIRDDRLREFVKLYEKGAAAAKLPENRKYVQRKYRVPDAASRTMLKLMTDTFEEAMPSTSPMTEMDARQAIPREGKKRIPMQGGGSIEQRMLSMLENASNAIKKGAPAVEEPDEMEGEEPAPVPATQPDRQEAV